MKKQIKKDESLFETTHMKVTTFCCCLITFGILHNLACIVLMPDGKESATMVLFNIFDKLFDIL